MSAAGYPNRVSKVVVAGMSRRERGRITLLTRLYDLATMSNHGYNICDKRTNLRLPISKRSRRDPAISWFFPFLRLGCFVYSLRDSHQERSLSSLSFAPRRLDRRRLRRHLGSCCRDGASYRGNDVTRGVEWRIPSARKTECKACILRQRR